MNRDNSISVIIATYNSSETLDQAIQSIISQNYPNIELIVIDGASTDRTIKIIENYSTSIKYWVSEPDDGIYDAWNKGLSHATGDWIMFIGSDDYLLDDALKKYSKFIDQLDESVLYISSRIKIVDKNLQEIRVKGWKWAWPKFLNDMTVAHPGSLHSKLLFDRYGLFNTDYKIVGDFELLLRAGKNLKAGYLDDITLVMRQGGASDSLSAIVEHIKASVTTGKQKKCIALMNASKVMLKTVAKKTLSKFGLNAYLKK